MYLFIGAVVLVTTVVLYYVLVGLLTTRFGWNNAVVRFAEAANVYVALLLFISTCALLAGPRFLQQEFNRIPLAILVVAAVLAAAWAVFGLVPRRSRIQRTGSLATCHLMVLGGNVVYGAVSIVPIIRSALGIAREGEQHIFWFGFIAFPLALLLWALGLIGIYSISPHPASDEAKPPSVEA